MKKILLIDDDKSILKSLTDLLALANYEVVSTDDSINGIKLAEKFNPDLIICDIMMPNLDGLGVLHQLNKNLNTLNIPFIFLTAKTEFTDIRKGMESGADDYLLKPFTPSELLRAIEVRLEKRNKLLHNLSNLKSIEKKSSSIKKKLSKDSFIILMNSDKPENIKVGTIVYIEAMEKYSKVVLNDGKKITVRKLMKEWDAVLPVDTFVRIHRSIIINLEFVSRMEKWFNNSFRIYLKNIEKPFEASRRYSAMLKSKINF